MANKPCNTIEFQNGQVILRGPGVTYVIPWTGDAPLDAAAINVRFDALTASVADLASRLPEGPNVFVISPAPEQA